MAATTASFADLLEPIMREVAFEKFNYYTNEYDKICTVVQSRKAWETTSEVADLDMFVEKTEGNSVTYETLVQGYDKKITNVTYAKGISISKELFEDEQYPIMKNMASALGKSAKLTMEQLAANLLNYGFVSTYNTAGDGQCLFYTAHTNPNGKSGTYSNIATASDLAISTLKDAITALETTESESGNPLAIKAKKLVVAPANQFQAMQLLQSSHIPNSANNDINPVNGWGIELVVNHFLTDSDAWFLICDQSPLIFQMRAAFDLTKDVDTNTQNALFLGRFRAGTGFNNPRGIYGNAGA